jgi:KUP system potassium uptake protein
MPPKVLWAFNPFLGFDILREHGFRGFLAPGSVFLAVTGAEALCADLGHFGRRPIRLGWQSILLPALALNYLGQAAKILRTPSAAENPFYASVPDWALYPAITLATAATVIASQALISGAFSLTLQAMQLGY